MSDLAKVAGVSNEDLAPIAESLKYALQEQVAVRTHDMTFSDRFYKLITKAAVDKNTKEVSDRLGKVADTQRERARRSDARKDSPQAADVAGRGAAGGGGRTDAELKVDPTTSVEQRIAIRQRERRGAGG